MASQESQLNITEEELERFQKAMKNEEFRKMFSDYAKEISDPENRKRYEEEIAQLEAERGMDVKFVNPQDGYVIKTSIKSADGMKAFINICQSDAISKATSREDSRKVDSKDVKGNEWLIPYSLNQPRDDLDKAQKKCKVYDVIFHTSTYEMGEKDPRFKQLIHNTTFDAIETNWKVKLDRKNLKYPKMKFKGTKTSTIIRTSNDKGGKNAGEDIVIGDKRLPYPYKNKPPETKEKTVASQDKTTDVTDERNEDSSSLEHGALSSSNHSYTPEYTIVHRGHLDLQNFTNARDSRASTRPQELVVHIELPLCETSAGVDLDIFEKQLVLDSTDPKYHLDLTLSYPVSEDEGRAQFDKSKRRLTVTLPVLPAPAITLNGYADHEAAGDKVNGLVTEVISDNDDGELERGGDKGVSDGGDDGAEDGARECVGDDHDGKGGSGDHDGSYGDSNMNGIKNGIEGDGDNLDSHDHKDIENSDETKHKTFQDLNHKLRVNNSSGIACPLFKIPPYSFHQNSESVTFILHVSNVSLDTMSLGFNKNKCCIDFPSSIDTSSILQSPGYSLHIQFPDDCLIDSERSNVDITEINLVLVLYKQENCLGMWQWFMIGSDENTLEKKDFLTDETLQKSLNEGKDHWAQQPVSVIHKVESTSVEETVIQLDIKREDSSHPPAMGSILTTTEEILFNEVQNDEIQKIETKNGSDVLNEKDDTVLVNYGELDEVEVIDESYENVVDDLNEPQRLSTVQENEPTSEVKNETTVGDIEMQKARAIKCRKNRRRRRRSTGSHDQSSSVSEEEGGDASTRRGKHGRRLRKTRSLSFGSSADSHDDVEHDGRRCVRFNPVPEVHVFSNRADKRKLKELRKQQLLSGNTEPVIVSPRTSTETIRILKSSLKDTRSSTSDKESYSVSSDDASAVHDNEISSGCKDENNFIDDSCATNDGDGLKNDGDNDNDNDDDDDDGDGDDSFVKVEKPELTNPLIFDLDD